MTTWSDPDLNQTEQWAAQEQWAAEYAHPGQTCEEYETAANPRACHYPDITVQLTGQDGNAMIIMSAVSLALRRAGHADRTAMEWVNVE